MTVKPKQGLLEKQKFSYNILTWWLIVLSRLMAFLLVVQYSYLAVILVYPKNFTILFTRHESRKDDCVSEMNDYLDMN